MENQLSGFLRRKLRRGLIMRRRLETARVSTRARQRLDRILKQVPDGSSTPVRHGAFRTALEARLNERARRDGVELDEFTRVYVAETNRLRAERRAKVADARRACETIDRRQMQILGYLNSGFGEVEAWKIEVR